MKDKYKYENFKKLVKNSISYKELHIKLGGAKGLNSRNNSTLRKYIKKYNLDISHFHFKNTPRSQAKPLTEYLTKNSTYSKMSLKHRLIKEGFKSEQCEVCGQPNVWNGKHLIMILDHINGISNDNRLENLRMVCPNCNYQLDTTCRGKHILPKKECLVCKKPILRRRKYCSKKCQYISPTNLALSLSKRKVERPSYQSLLEDKAEMSLSAIGRKYGVTINAVKKWIKIYER